MGVGGTTSPLRRCASSPRASGGAKPRLAGRRTASIPPTPKTSGAPMRLDGGETGGMLGATSRRKAGWAAYTAVPRTTPVAELAPCGDRALDG